jgi:hypothetical protein
MPLVIQEFLFNFYSLVNFSNVPLLLIFNCVPLWLENLLLYDINFWIVQCPLYILSDTNMLIFTFLLLLSYGTVLLSSCRQHTLDLNLFLFLWAFQWNCWYDWMYLLFNFLFYESTHTHTYTHTYLYQLFFSGCSRAYYCLLYANLIPVSYRNIPPVWLCIQPVAWIFVSHTKVIYWNTHHDSICKNLWEIIDYDDEVLMYGTLIP